MRDLLEDAEGAAERGDVGPGKANRELDKPKFPKRFYKRVEVVEVDGSFVIALDDKHIKTPGRAVLSLPTKQAAQLVADEWQAVEDEINPMKMPCTRIVNTAIDGVTSETQAVMEDIIRYASSDLLCYRADSPKELVANQQAIWDPILDWYADNLGARFETGEGIAHVPQPKEAITLYGAKLREHEDGLKLAVLHTFTSITGSALIALALAEGQLNADEAWEAGFVDENWNIAQWGEDWESKEMRHSKRLDFDAAYKLFQAVTTSDQA